MPENYRVIFHDDFAARLRHLRALTLRDPDGSVARVYSAAIDAAKGLAAGRERSMNGERLGYSRTHSDLRDCAEIKVEVLKEYTNAGKPRGPSHRMIYREFHGTADDPRPIRQIVAFEHRANGLPFAVAAAALGRPVGRPSAALTHLPAPRPAIGADKDPERPITPPRLPLPPDLAAALATSTRRVPGRPAEAARAMPTRVGKATAVHREH